MAILQDNGRRDTGHNGQWHSSRGGDADVTLLSVTHGKLILSRSVDLQVDGATEDNLP